MSALKRRSNQDITQNPSEIFNILNRSSSVGRKLADSVPSSRRHLSDYFGHQVYPNSFFFYPVTLSEVESELSTPLNKAYGLYSCPICILKGANHIASTTVAEIMNMSVQTGVYPSKLKHAKITPDQCIRQVTYTCHCDTFFILNETRPLSRGMTTVYWLLL